jgi:hypothetical protein
MVWDRAYKHLPLDSGKLVVPSTQRLTLLFAFSRVKCHAFIFPMHAQYPTSYRFMYVHPDSVKQLVVITKFIVPVSQSCYFLLVTLASTLLTYSAKITSSYRSLSSVFQVICWRYVFRLERPACLVLCPCVLQAPSI